MHLPQPRGGDASQPQPLTPSAPSPTTPVLTGAWAAWADSWAINLRARNISPETLKLYLQALANLAEWAVAHGKADPLQLTHEDMEAYFAYFLDRKHKQTGRPLSPAYIRKDFTSLRVFGKWLATREGEINIMEGIKEPIVPEKLVQIIEDDDLRKLLQACEGRDFAQRRDTALIRLMLEPGGPRRSELMGIELDGLDLRAQTALVLGKGRKDRLVPFGMKTTEALSRYLRVRAAHKDAHLAALWLAASPHRGAMGVDGLRQMLIRRTGNAELGHLNPHRFRHTSFNAFMDGGGDIPAAMALYGWDSDAMPLRYAKSAVQRRALKLARRISPMDRI